MKNIWIFNQYNMPPEHGHLNRHFIIGKYLKKSGYNPFVFVGSYLHNTEKQMIHDKSLVKGYKNCDFNYFYIKTCDYSNSKAKRIYAMFEYYINLLRVTINIKKPDLIIGSSPHPLAAIAAIRLAKKYGCQSIVEIRDLWPESFVAYNIIKKNNPILKLLYAGEKWIYKKADKLIFTMEGGRDYIIEKGWDKGHGGPIDLSKVYHINNGVDLEEFDYNREHCIIEDKDLEDENTFKVIYTGSIRLVNKVGKIIDVAKILSDQNVKFLIWGDGDQLEHLRKRIRSENIRNVCFKGRVDKKYIPYITSKAQLNIISGDNLPLYRYGSSANKLFDYFASGRPTLNTKTFRYSLINRYRAGLELEDSSSERVAESVMYFKNLNISDYEEYCKNARKAAQDYSFKNLTMKLIEIIES